MDPADDVATGTLDTILAALDEADTALRDIYRKLADDPDQADEHEPQRAELHARRLQLSQRVGLAVLAREMAARASCSESPSADTEAEVPTAVDEQAAGVSDPVEEAPRHACVRGTERHTGQQDAGGPALVYSMVCICSTEKPRALRGADERRVGGRGAPVRSPRGTQAIHPSRVAHRRHPRGSRHRGRTRVTPGRSRSRI
jgi:hypothetical protein